MLRKRLGDRWDIAFADMVPHGPIVRQWCCASCECYRECQGKDVCLWQIAVLLQREETDMEREHPDALNEGELGYKLK